MTWLTWRQHRGEAAAILAALVVLGVAVLLLTVDGSGILTTISRGCASGVCEGTAGNPAQWFESGLENDWTLVLVAVIALPAVFGVFVGAPMIARELEHGTHLVAWSQGVTRHRWFVSRVTLVALGSVVGGAILAALAQGWFAMQADLGNTGSLPIWSGFDIAPPVVIAYTLFALALGAAAGAAFRRTVPAMVVTLVAYIAVRVSVVQAIRWRYLAPITVRWPIKGQVNSVTSPGPSAWQLSSGTPFVDAAGHPLKTAYVNRLITQCPAPTASCVNSLSRVYMTYQYQPASRFWLFQGIEAAIFVLLALALLTLAYRLVMRIR